MLPENRAIFEKYRSIRNEARSFTHMEQDELLKAYRDEVDPYYHFNRGCSECLKGFVNTVYKWYDSHMAEQQGI
jgi:hypothetical protein